MQDIYCAKCHDNTVTENNGWYECTECNTKIYNKLSTISLTENEMKELYAGKAVFLKNFTAYEPSTYHYNANISLAFDGKKLIYDFNVPQINEIKCSCGGTIKQVYQRYKCYQCKKGVLSYCYKSRLSLKNAYELFEKGQTLIKADDGQYKLLSYSNEGGYSIEYVYESPGTSS